MIEFYGEKSKQTPSLRKDKTKRIRHTENTNLQLMTEIDFRPNNWVMRRARALAPVAGERMWTEEG